MRILHLTFHIGCANVIADLLDVETKIVTSGRDGFYYNMTSERANDAWRKHSDYFNQFDVIITSDTAPLSRIFLQNGFKGKLIIYICNRFNYFDSQDVPFPDQGYHELMRTVKDIPNVHLIGNTPFETVYAADYGVEVEDTILPVRKPHYRKDKVGFYVPTYHNDTTFGLFNECEAAGLNVTTGRYKDINDLAGFTAVIHYPYAWSTIALFDALSVGIPYIVPSKKLLKKLLKQEGYWFQNMSYLNDHISIGEFYCRNNFVKHFDTLDDIRTMHINHDLIYGYAEELYIQNKKKWNNILNS